MRCTFMRHTLIRYTPMRCTPMRYMPVRYTPIRLTPKRDTPEGHTHDVHTQNVHTYGPRDICGFWWSLAVPHFSIWRSVATWQFGALLPPVCPGTPKLGGELVLARIHQRFWFLSSFFCYPCVERVT